MRVRPTKADYLAALRQPATWVEISVGLVAGVILTVIVNFIGGGAGGWIALPIVFGSMIGAAAQRSARERASRSTS